MQLDSKETELTKQVNIALEDGEITADQGAIIEKLQGEIAEITNKVAETETEAKMEALKIKFGAGAIDSESFAQLQEELDALLESSTSRYDDALTTSITSLKLQLDEGAIDKNEYDAQIKALTEGYNANIGELTAKADKLKVDVLGEPEVTNKFEGTAADFGVNPEYEFPTAADILAEYSGNKFEGRKLEDFGVKDSYNLNTNVNVTRNWKYIDVGKQSDPSGGSGFRGGLFGPSGIRQFSNGGMVAGGAQLITVAEEGSPEMIIPMSSQRRGRALKLWAQAGHMLDVPGFARGGIAGGSGDEGLRYRAEEGSAGSTAETSGVQINVGGVTVEVNVQGGGDTNIAQAIAAQSGEIADQIAGILADAFSAQFENTPTKGVA